MIGGSQSQETGLKGKFNDVPAFMTAISRNLAVDITAKRGYRGRTDCRKGVMSSAAESCSNLSNGVWSRVVHSGPQANFPLCELRRITTGPTETTEG